MNLTLISLLLCTNHNKPCQQLWKNVVSLWRLGTVMKDVSKVQNKRMQGTIQHNLSCQVTYQKKKKTKIWVAKLFQYNDQVFVWEFVHNQHNIQIFYTPYRQYMAT